jgi:hypothetical protein
MSGYLKLPMVIELTDDYCFSYIYLIRLMKWKQHLENFFIFFLLEHISKQSISITFRFIILLNNVIHPLSLLIRAIIEYLSSFITNYNHTFTNIAYTRKYSISQVNHVFFFLQTIQSYFKYILSFEKWLFLD